MRVFSGGKCCGPLDPRDLTVEIDPSFRNLRPMRPINRGPNSHPSSSSSSSSSSSIDPSFRNLRPMRPINSGPNSAETLRFFSV